MGIYEELQQDISEALSTDLADAARQITFITYTNVYDEDLMKNVRLETTSVVRAINIKSIEGENIDVPTSNDIVQYLILDTDLAVDLKLEMKIIDGDKEYKVSSITTDPTKSTWTVTARKWA